METSWNSALWRQFGAAIDMLDNAVVACPDSLWTEQVWRVPPSSDFPPQFAQFWYLTYHALVWLDLYLSGVPEEDFAPPAPFVRRVLDSAEGLPVQPYAKEQLRTYLASLREKCQRHADRADGRAGAPACRISLVGWAAHQFSGAANLQSAPHPGTRGPTEPLPRAARHPG